jgi:hypothetical protein
MKKTLSISLILLIISCGPSEQEKKRISQEKKEQELTDRANKEASLPVFRHEYNYQVFKKLDISGKSMNDIVSFFGKPKCIKYSVNYSDGYGIYYIIWNQNGSLKINSDDGKECYLQLMVYDFFADDVNIGSDGARFTELYQYLLNHELPQKSSLSIQESNYSTLDEQIKNWKEPVADNFSHLMYREFSDQF